MARSGHNGHGILSSRETEREEERGKKSHARRKGARESGWAEEGEGRRNLPLSLTRACMHEGEKERRVIAGERAIGSEREKHGDHSRERDSTRERENDQKRGGLLKRGKREEGEREVITCIFNLNYYHI